MTEPRLNTAAASQSAGGPASAIPSSGVKSVETASMDRCRTLAELFLARVRATPNALAYQYPGTDGAYLELSWREAAVRVRAIASGLRALGLSSEERCAIISSTRIEWILVDLAVLCAGAATTAVYPTTPAADCRYMLADAECVVAFVENHEQLEKLRANRAALGQVRQVVLIEGDAGADDWVISLSALESIGERYDQAHPDEFERAAARIEPHQLATLIYTSGTTGTPKGVRLTHDGWLYQSGVGAALGLLSPDDHQYLWLPLSHSMGKVLEVCAIHVGFPTTVDGRVAELMENLIRVRPTFMGAPPRIFERIYAKIMTGAERSGGPRRALFRWACRVGTEVSRLRQSGTEPRGLLRAKFRVADKLVFAKLRARFGGRMRFMLSGSAPLSRELAEFFHAAGLLVLEGYGLTETSAGAVLNRLDAFSFGTVGKPLPGTELHLDGDGEILLRSRGVMHGYHGLPEDTRDVLRSDGWLRTGDLGELDAHGFLRITGRKKDLIKLSSGLYVAPQKLENALKSACPCLTQVIVHGDKRDYCCALVTVDPDLVVHQESGTPEGGSSHATRALIQGAISHLNATLASHERIKKFVILPSELSVETGTLTPSMKVRRSAAEELHRDLLNELYSDASTRSDANSAPVWTVAP